MERVLALTRHFGIQTLVCINKWELNARVADQIERRARLIGASTAGRIGYDRMMTEAQIEGVTVVEYGGRAAEDIRKVWEGLVSSMESSELSAAM